MMDETPYHDDIARYNQTLTQASGEICTLLAGLISRGLPEAESKIWHAHPVWFIDGNPIAGYCQLKTGIRLMFWSGESFEEVRLRPGTGKFKDASITYTDPADIDPTDVERWLGKARVIQWDYKNIVKRKGVLERLK